jgi:transposase
MTAGLFGDLPEERGPERSGAWAGKARVMRPERSQASWEMVVLDQLVAADHPVRLVASFVEGLELSPLYNEVQAREHGPGRDGIDPAILLALWLYAAIDAVGSAREVARLCESELAYRWLCGGVKVYAHALSDFRSGHMEFLDQLLSDSVTALVADGLVKLEILAHDSMKVRASAGSGSFRREGRLELIRKEVEQRIETLKSELDGAADASARRKAKARLRAQEELRERTAKAQARMQELKAAQAKRRKKDRIDPKTGEDKPVRVSLTDPETRVLVMAGGERRPAWSLQITTDPTTLVAVGLSVHDGPDAGQIRPALEQIQARYGVRPKSALADCGFCDKKDISFAHTWGTAAIIPSNNQAKQGDEAYATPYANNLPGIKQWRERMVQNATKALYKLRSQTECVHAHLRNRDLWLLRSRGKAKVKAEVLIHLIAHNIICTARLRAAQA